MLLRSALREAAKHASWSRASESALTCVSSRVSGRSLHGVMRGETGLLARVGWANAPYMGESFASGKVEIRTRLSSGELSGSLGARRRAYGGGIGESIVSVARCCMAESAASELVVGRVRARMSDAIVIARPMTCFLEVCNLRTPSNSITT